MNKELKLLLIGMVSMFVCIVYFYFQQKGG
jgi:hypothetical protein